MYVNRKMALSENSTKFRKFGDFFEAGGKDIKLLSYKFSYLKMNYVTQVLI